MKDAEKALLATDLFLRIDYNTNNATNPLSKNNFNCVTSLAEKKHREHWTQQTQQQQINKIINQLISLPLKKIKIQILLNVQSFLWGQAGLPVSNHTHSLTQKVQRPLTHLSASLTQSVLKSSPAALSAAPQIVNWPPFRPLPLLSVIQRWVWSQA